MAKKVDVIFVFQSQPPHGVTVNLIPRSRPKDMPDAKPTDLTPVAMKKVKGTNGTYIAKGFELPVALDLATHKLLFRVVATVTSGGVKQNVSVVDSHAVNHLGL